MDVARAAGRPSGLSPGRAPAWKDSVSPTPNTRVGPDRLCAEGPEVWGVLPAPSDRLSSAPLQSKQNSESAVSSTVNPIVIHKRSKVKTEAEGLRPASPVTLTQVTCPPPSRLQAGPGLVRGVSSLGAELLLVKDEQVAACTNK